MIILASLGGALELYDFILFVIFSNEISNTFLPLEDKSLSLIVVFATFAVGYLARPLGGIIFSHFGDKYTRKKVFALSVSIIGAATLLIGLLPGYNSIGIAAPILLLMLRFIQGLAIGGEVPGAITFVAEHMPLYVGFACGCIYLFVNSGVILAEMTKMVLLHFDQSYAWRLAFILGGLLAIISYSLRKKLAESEIFKAEKTRHKVPFFALCSKYQKNMILAIFIAGGHASSISLLFLYVVPHMELLGFSPDYVNNLNMVATVVMALCCLLGGLISDFVSKKHMLVFGFLTLIPAGWYLYYSIYQVGHIMAAYILVGVLIGGVAGPMAGHLSKMFSTDVRYSGIAFCYNIGFAVFGGLALFLTSCYMKLSGDNMAPCYVLTSTLSAAILASLLTR